MKFSAGAQKTDFFEVRELRESSPPVQVTLGDLADGRVEVAEEEQGLPVLGVPVEPLAVQGHQPGDNLGHLLIGQ